MTEREAIKRALELLPQMRDSQWVTALGQVTAIYTDEAKEAFNIAIAALEKQIPKKVRVTTSTKRCSVCGRQLSGVGNIHPERNYCQKCGQAIDWEEEA